MRGLSHDLSNVAAMGPEDEPRDRRPHAGEVMRTAK